MDLTFRIIWFEDVDEWYNTLSRRVSKYIRDKNFKVEIMRIDKASNFNLKEHQLQNFDLLMVDYELEKIYEDEQNNEKRIYGTEIIRMIRESNFVNDVLFYSSHGFEVINGVMKQEGLQGVFIADRQNDEFLEKVKLLVDKAIRRANNLINIRGVVMDTTSDFDNKIRDLISIIWPILGDKEQKIANDIKKKILKDNVKTAEKLDERYTNINVTNIDTLLNERDFSAIRQARLLSWCIESNVELKKKLQENFKKYLQLNNGLEQGKFYDLYNDDIIKYRNALAHVKNAPSIDSKVIIGEVDGQPIQFDQELCDQLRKKLINYESVLNDMYEYIESNY
ncbi:MAG: hypothetical protein E7247_12925 [Paenibacillaceae bacterium]|nr:hypothetical protein [Paenibacillaceae bacterium]